MKSWPISFPSGIRRTSTTPAAPDYGTSRALTAA
jgi:hypothetical protein